MEEEGGGGLIGQVNLCSRHGRSWDSSPRYVDTGSRTPYGCCILSLVIL